MNRPLRWIQPRARQQRYELQSDEGVLATLNFPSAWKSLAVAESDSGCWTFERVGFWRQRTLVHLCGRGQTEELLHVHRETWSSGGTFTLPDGRAYRFKPNFWVTRYTLSDLQGQALLKYQRIGGFFHVSAEVEVLPEAHVLNDVLPWLLPFTWYWVLMARRDAAASAAAA